jgi:ABC-type branched-subunit amino acid transport system ATPase component
MSFLEVKNIDVYYGDVQVIFDLSLEIAEGEVVSIIGGNGAGKSTLLKTISGLMHPVKGEIFSKTLQSKPRLRKKLWNAGSYRCRRGGGFLP